MFNLCRIFIILYCWEIVFRCELFFDHFKLIRKHSEIFFSNMFTFSYFRKENVKLYKHFILFCVKKILFFLKKYKKEYKKVVILENSYECVFKCDTNFRQTFSFYYSIQCTTAPDRYSTIFTQIKIAFSL